MRHRHRRVRARGLQTAQLPFLGSLQREGISPPDWGFPLGIELEPTLDCRLVDSPEGLQRVLKYMAKPIDMVRPYTIAARTANYEAMWEINLAVAEFLAGHTCYVEGRRQRESWGILDPRRRRDFIGVRLDEIAGQP